MDIETYYSILEWRGEQPTKLDESSEKEFGRKIYEKDIELGKTVWVNNKSKDFKYYLFYYDPILSMLSSVTYDWNETFIVLLFILNMSSILATLTASIGFNEMLSINTNMEEIMNDNISISRTTNENISLNEMLLMILCASFNGLILCIFQLKWREFERKKQQKLSTFIINQNGITIIMFTVMLLSLGYYFMINELNFYSFFLTVYALQFVFGWSFEIFALYILFIRGWKRDHLMVQLIPNYLKDGSFANFSLPKCIYYITYKDYQEWKEWIQYKKKINHKNNDHDTNNDESDDLYDESDGLLTTTTLRA